MKQMLVLQSSAVIIGTVIGAGILGLPFAFVQAGFWTGMIVLGLIGACILILSLFFGEVTLRTKELHQLTGYTEKYLGTIFKNIQGFLLLFGMYSALLAYTIGLGEIFSTVLSGSAFAWSIGAYLVLAFFVIRGLNIIKRAEFVIGILILGLLFTLALIATPHMDFKALSGFDWRAFFVPYGAILFACSGIVAIPEAREVLHAKRAEKSLKMAILIGNSVPVIVYAIFSLIVVAVTGTETSEIATVGLSSAIGPVALIVGGLFSIMAMSSSFMTLGVAMKSIFQYDYHAPQVLAIILTLSLPLVLFLLGVRDFFSVVSVAGALSVGLTGLISVATFWRARHHGDRKPEYIIPDWLAVPASVVIVLVFIARLAYTL